MMADRTSTPSEQQQQQQQQRRAASTAAAAAAAADFHSTPQFPHHQGPRTWLIVAGVSSVGLRLARMLLAHGDNVVLGVAPAAYDDVHTAVTAAAATAAAASAAAAATTNPLSDSSTATTTAAATAAPAPVDCGSSSGGVAGGGGLLVSGAAATFLDHPFARYESELLRQFLAELDEDEQREETEGGGGGDGDDEDSGDEGGDSEMEDVNPTSSPPAGDGDEATLGGKHGPGGVDDEDVDDEDSDDNDEEDDDDDDEDDDSSSPPHHRRSHPPPRRRLRCVRLDPRATAQCQSAVATATAAFGHLDIVVCSSSEVVVGTVEELGASEETLALVREQFEVNFFSSVNAIKACVPAMRISGKGGHIVVITGISGHLGTPGLGAYCSAGWALEGYCDSIAYEIAPFNIKVSIVQPQLETAVLPNRVKAPPSLPQYTPPSHPAPLARNVIGGLLDRIHGTEHSPSHGGGGGGEEQRRQESVATEQTSGSEDHPNQHQNLRSVSRTLGSSTAVSLHEPRLPSQLLDGLIKETLFSVCAIGGHPSPPQRHIVGTEGVISVKEKLKTVSIELEDLVQASTAVDLVQEERE